jgi:hypothetical protein
VTATDPRAAALTEAIHGAMADLAVYDNHERQNVCEAVASHAIAALPPDFCGHDDRTIKRLSKAARLALGILSDLSVAFHQTGSIRDHADPKDRTGWNVHGIETCEDAYCLDARIALHALRAALGDEA